jgi:hypothetical protein
MTPLDKTLKRSLNVNGVDYVVAISPDALRLTRKGKRLGIELKWADITSGESALAVALRASVGRFEDDAQQSNGRKAAKGKDSSLARTQSVARPAPKGRRSRPARQ